MKIDIQIVTAHQLGIFAQVKAFLLQSLFVKQ